jgi:amino acid transporter
MKGTKYAMLWSELKRILIGEPLPSAREKHERMAIPIALSVFASDALSSTAYATQEILQALNVELLRTYPLLVSFLSIPVAVSITLLLAVVIISYRQVIKAYDDGGGSYQVAKENLSQGASHVAGAALMIDYVLTAAVSVSAAVDALVSLGWITPDQKVLLALAFLAVITLINLRGVKESGAIFSIPSYIFIITMLLLLGKGGFMIATGQVPVDFSHGILASTGVPQEAWSSLWNTSLLLILVKAFSHGCAALTGIEAISNGVKAFKEPAAENANKTMTMMGVILATIFLGITILAFAFQLLPAEHETTVSQVGRAVFGDGTFLYVLLQVITAMILIFAANTSYSGFPRLASILAHDGYLPRQFKNMGDRLVFTNGIIFLGFVSGLLVMLYGADTHGLIPLYAVGVFLSFTLAQAGMVVYHQKGKAPGWRKRQWINGFGALVTGAATIILAVEKFTEGAWIVIAAIPAIMFVFNAVKDHYDSVSRQLALPTGVQGHEPRPIEHTVLVLVSGLHRGTIPALEYARTLSAHVEAVHVELYADSTQQLMKQWEDWGCGVPLTVLKSPFRSITRPLLDYIDEVEGRHAHNLVTIIIPEFVTKKFWHNFLHNQSSLLIRTLLSIKKGKVVTTVRYYLEQ